MPVDPPPKLLLEDGTSFLLLEDGTSFLLLEGDTSEPSTDAPPKKWVPSHGFRARRWRRR